jgi:mannose-6-phosphate isomerase-like protein (cupin superfamily)
VKPGFLHHDPAREYDTPELCAINELSNTAADEDLSIARARVAPGVATRWHVLRGIAERYVILEGEGVAEVGEGPSERVAPGSVVLIPPGVRQRIRNTGAADLVFLALCTPRFRPEAYEDVDDRSL